MESDDDVKTDAYSALSADEIIQSLLAAMGPVVCEELRRTGRSGDEVTFTPQELNKALLSPEKTLETLAALIIMDEAVMAAQKKLIPAAAKISNSVTFVSASCIRTAPPSS